MAEAEGKQGANVMCMHEIVNVRSGNLNCTCFTARIYKHEWYQWQ